jgi:NIMA (never in mitosis gene a)-related kinase
MENFKIIAKIGEGAYSTVYTVRRIEDNQLYALKKVKIKQLSKKEKQNALNEIRILASIKSPFIISYKESFVDELDQTLCIVMEYADEGDLFQKITLYQKLKTSFDEADIWRIFIQITKGLNDLHEYKILHRDLKSANVFLFRNGSAKLGDLNVSKITYRGLGCTQTGTPYYASPEVWKDNPYDLKSDIWSLGCITYEMAMLKTPFRSNTMEGLFQKIIKGDYPRLIKKYSEDLNYVISTMIRVHSKERPTTGEILEMEEVQKKNEEYDIFKKFGYNNEENKNNNDVKELKRELKDEEEKEDIKVVIDTIKIPNKFILLNSNLPKARYDNNNKDIKNNISKESKNAISSNKNLEELPKLDIKNRIAYKKKENLKKFKMKIKDSNNGGKNEMKKIRLKNKKLDSSLYRSIDMKLIQE